MIANGCELNGTRLLGRMTVDNMISNHIGADRPVYIRGSGYGFGLGFGVLTNSAQAPDALSIGSYTWGGAYGTLYWADPVEDLIGILMIQIRPYNHLGIRPLFSNVVTQAVVDSLSDQKPKILGRADSPVGIDPGPAVSKAVSPGQPPPGRSWARAVLRLARDDSPQ